jgi:hypothetical protein
MTMLLLSASIAGTALRCVLTALFICTFVASTSKWLQRELGRNSIRQRCYRTIGENFSEIYQTVMQYSKAYMTLYHEYHSNRMKKMFRYDKATNKWVSNELTTEVAPDHNQKDSSIFFNDEQERILKRTSSEADVQKRLKLASKISMQAEEWGFFTNPNFIQVLYLKTSFGDITMEEYDWHIQAWRSYQKKKEIKEHDDKFIMPKRRLVPLTNPIRRVVPKQKATPTPVPQKGIYISVNSRPKVALMPHTKPVAPSTKPPLYPKKSNPRKRPIVMLETITEH